jgi:hypothetical protein
MMGGLFVLTPYLQIVQGNDAQGTGIRLLPMIAALMVGAMASDRLTARWGTKGVVTAGLLLTASGLALLSRAGADTGYGLIGAALAVMGLGMGLAMPPAMDAILATLPSAQTGVGTALSRTLQQIAASFGVAILGSILNSVYRGDLTGRLTALPPQIRVAVQDSVAGAAAAARHLPDPLAGSLVQAADHAYARGMADVLLVCAGLMLAGALLVALFLPARAVDTSHAETPEHERSPVTAMT